MSNARPHVVTANLTSDGSPVYLTADRNWSPDLKKAGVIECENLRAELLQAAKKQEETVCDPYAFKVHVNGHGVEALSAREQIRATGPTVRIRRPD